VNDRTKDHVVEFNLNGYVQVKLTDHGRRIHREWHDELDKFARGHIGIYTPPEEKDGWSRWQAWELMSIFGDHCYNGCKTPFETTIRIETNTP
jgi:hypothetical protein